MQLVFLVAAGIGPVGHARAAEPAHAKLVGDFNEAVYEEVAVSGALVVGIAAANALSGDAALAGLRIPTLADRVCLTVLSRDGVYFARNTYEVPPQVAAGSDSVVLLPFEGTSRPDLIRGYGPGDLAVRTTPGPCDDSAETYLVASARTEAASVDLLINGFGATAVYYRVADGTGADCQELTEGRRTSYDYRCAIPSGSLGDGPQLVSIERERYGRPLGSVEIELRLRAQR